MMDRHDIAHYGIAAILAGVVGWSVAPKAGDKFAVDASAMVSPASPVKVGVLCAPGCGKRAQLLADALKTQGYDVVTGPGMASDPDTLRVFSRDQHGAWLAKDLTRATSLHVDNFDQEPDAGDIEVLVGPVGDAK